MVQLAAARLPRRWAVLFCCVCFRVAAARVLLRCVARVAFGPWFYGLRRACLSLLCMLASRVCELGMPTRREHVAVYASRPCVVSTRPCMHTMHSKQLPRPDKTSQASVAQPEQSSTVNRLWVAAAACMTPSVRWSIDRWAASSSEPNTAWPPWRMQHNRTTMRACGHPSVCSATSQTVRGRQSGTHGMSPTSGRHGAAASRQGPGPGPGREETCRGLCDAAIRRRNNASGVWARSGQPHCAQHAQHARGRSAGIMMHAAQMWTVRPCAVGSEACHVCGVVVLVLVY